MNSDRPIHDSSHDMLERKEFFINTCCEWAERQSNDLCGLDGHRITAGEKAKLLADRSALKAAFEGMGL